MSKYLVWCFSGDIRKEKRSDSKREAEKVYTNAVKSGQYDSVTLRKEEKTHGHAIKSWSKENGEVQLFYRKSSVVLSSINDLA